MLQIREARAKVWEQEEFNRKELAEELMEQQKRRVDSSDDEGEAPSCSDNEDTKEHNVGVSRNHNRKRSRSSDEESEPKIKKRKPTNNREKQWRVSTRCRLLFASSCAMSLVAARVWVHRSFAKSTSLHNVSDQRVSKCIHLPQR